MTIAILTTLIANACFQPDYTFSEKELCIEVITNCAVVGAGEVSQHYKDCFTKEELRSGK